MVWVLGFIGSIVVFGAYGVTQVTNRRELQARVKPERIGEVGHSELSLMCLEQLYRQDLSLNHLDDCKRTVIIRRRGNLSVLGTTLKARIRPEHLNSVTNVVADLEQFPDLL